jgi:hypothetical protein
MACFLLPKMRNDISCIELCEADIAMSSLEGMHLRRGTVGRGKGEWGRRGGQYTANQGPEWTGIGTTTQRRDFQVSKGRVPRDKGRDNKKELSGRGLGHAPLCIYCANTRLCLGYK